MNESHPISDRRSARRRNVSLKVVLDQADAVTRDFSLSGLYLQTNRPVSMGENLLLRLALPDPGNPECHWVTCSGTVVRVEAGDGGVGAAIRLEMSTLGLLAGAA